MSRKKKAMPKRPIQHVQEGRSRAAFSEALPEEWVFRTQDQDYGIDGEVEIFEDGLATGRLFKVQLKASSAKATKTGLKVRLTEEKVGYFSELRLPVLVVLLHTPTRKMYGRWFHSFDPHYGGETRKGVTLSFGAIDVLERARWDAIAADVEMYYKARDPKWALPMDFKLSFDDSRDLGLDADQLVLAVQNIAGSFPDLLRIEEGRDDPGAATIAIEADAIRVSFRGVASATAHSPELSDAANLIEVANDVLLTVALAFDQVGQLDAAARIATAVGPGSRLIFAPDVLFRIIGMLARSHRIVEALALAAEFGKEKGKDGELIASLFLMPALIRGGQLSRHEKDNVTRYLRDQIAHSTGGGSSRNIAVAHYNLANHLGSKEEWALAASHFALAAKYDPDYMKRSYFPREFAGALFLSNQFALAAEMYAHAERLGGDPMIPALRADALLFAGLYEEARLAFEDYNACAVGLEADEWRLKEWTAKAIVKVAGSRQNRLPEEASKRAKLVDDLAEHERKRALDSALELDGLCPDAWFCLGLEIASEEKPDRAAACFLVSAVLRPHDIDAWALSTIFGDPEDGLTRDALSCAFRWNREPFLGRLTELVKSLDDETLAEGILDAARAAADEVKRRPARPAQIRFLGEGADYEAIRLSPPSEPEERS